MTTLPAWPAIKYAPLRDSFQQSQVTNPAIRTDMNSGTTRQRRKYTMRIAIQKFTIRFCNTDIATFNTFYETTLGDGCARFTMSVWNGSVFVTRNVAFKADTPPTYGVSGLTHQDVSMTLLVENL